MVNELKLIEKAMELHPGMDKQDIVIGYCPDNEEMKLEIYSICPDAEETGSDCAKCWNRDESEVKEKSAGD